MDIPMKELKCSISVSRQGDLLHYFYFHSTLKARKT